MENPWARGALRTNVARITTLRTFQIFLQKSVFIPVNAASLMPKMLSAKQPGDPVFKIVMANPVWLFLHRK